MQAEEIEINFIRTYFTFWHVHAKLALEMKFFHGQPKPLLHMADDFCDYFVAEASAFLRRGKEIYMLLSFGLIFIVGLLLAYLMEKVNLPRIIGLLATGMLLGPFVLGWLDPQILEISADLRQIALIIILIKAGLALDLSDLKKVGRPAILMSFFPACFEMLAYILLAPKLFGIPVADAAVMGAVLAAVSPAVVVPRMVHLIEQGYGTKKAIPQLILAGASCDDIFVIVLFSTFLSMAQSGEFHWVSFLDIPLSIILGIGVGAVFGILLFAVFSRMSKVVAPAKQTLIILATSFLLIALESWLKGTVALSRLLAIVALACVYKIKSPSQNISTLSRYFGEMWLGAEILLFVLVGAAVDIRYALTAGLQAILLIFAALIFRAAGVWVCLLGSQLNTRERIFCVIAYLPKATVQAAIGAVPLAAGLASGQLILSVAVLGILITAPLGAIGIDRSYHKLLTKD